MASFCGWFINISIFLMFFFMLFLVFFIFFHFYFHVFFIEWVFLVLKYNFYFNSLLFSIILLIVTLRVMLFSSYYLSGELNFYYYYFILIIFVLRMFSLNFSLNTFRMLLSWDLLGITRFFLVLFYNNWDRNSGSINTVLTNRLGDFFLFVFFSFSYFINFNFFSYIFFLWGPIIFLVLTAFTKSAQFPFRGWLPKAIRAPTPVSSLVHRSTLVTAGLLLLFNFSLMLINYKVIIVIFFVGLLTTFFSSLSAVVEEDIKKVVALSTLSQIGFSIVTLGLGYFLFSLVHLLSHALFKSCLFMQVGYLIHCSFGQQDGRYYNNLKYIPYFIQVQLLLTLFCLCGLFFYSGLVRKDLILEYFYSNNWYFLVVLLFFFTVYLTFFYRYRLWKIFFLYFSSSFYHYRSSILINFLSLIVSLGSIFFIWWLSLNLLFLPSLFVYIDFYVPLIYLSLFFFIFYFFKKFFISELKTKFLADYLPKLSQFLFLNFKFGELFLYKLSGTAISSLLSFRNFSSYYLLSNSYNSILLIVILLFMFLWDLILLKIFDLQSKD